MVSWQFVLLPHALFTHPSIRPYHLIWAFTLPPPTDTHSGERRGASVQPQPGRQHHQIPRYHLSHSQGKTPDHTERCSSAAQPRGREESRFELWLSNEGFYSRADNNWTPSCRSHGLSFRLFLSTCLLSVRFFSRLSHLFLCLSCPLQLSRARTGHSISLCFYLERCICFWTFIWGGFISYFFIKGGVGKFEKPARDTLFVIFHGMLLTSR